MSYLISDNLFDQTFQRQINDCFSTRAWNADGYGERITDDSILALGNFTLGVEITMNAAKSEVSPV